MMNDAEEVKLFYRYVDGDRTSLRKILVDNSARLYGFKDLRLDPLAPTVNYHRSQP